MSEQQEEKYVKSPKRGAGASASGNRQGTSAGSKQKVFALVDCNNFFVSCERLFQPALNHKPVAVLSNNDGCVIARSNEVKAMGVPMAAPFFKYRDLFERNNVTTFSANFTLYGDISERVVNTLRDYSPKTEVYSIDECFLQIDHLGITDYDSWAKQLSATVQSEVGVPVSVGVAPSKTLAKLATERAKREPEHRGGFSIVDSSGQEQAHRLAESLQQRPLEGVWGIGRRYATKLQKRGLRTAFDVASLTDEWVLKNMTIVGLKTIKELRGDSCIPLGDFSLDYRQKMASSTRSFGRKIRNLGELEAAIASLSARAAMRLRRKDQLAWQGSTFLRAQLPDKSHQYISTDFKLETPSAFTGDITKGAHRALRQIYDPDMKYEKGGVILTNLIDKGSQQLSLLSDSKKPTALQRQDDLMEAADSLALRYGKGVVLFASEKASAGKWVSKQQRISPMYTTRWDHLPTVKII